MAGAKVLDNVKVPPKDEEELELEKLVFGDAEGFEANLRKIDNLYDFSDSDGDDGDDGLRSGSESSDDEGAGLDGVQDDDLFFIDDGADDGANQASRARDSDEMEIDGDDYNGSDDDDDDSGAEGAAWVDSDDEKVNISLLGSDRTKKLRRSERESTVDGQAYTKRLRSQFEKIYPRPAWIAKLEDKLDAHDDAEGADDSGSDSGAGSDADEDRAAAAAAAADAAASSAILALLATTSSLIITKQLKLIAPNKISITRLKNANHARPSKGAIQSLAFHHSHPLLMTGGFDRTLRVYHIDGKHNNLVSSLHLRNSPITTCAFAPDTGAAGAASSNLIFAGGRRRYMNKWDLNSGEVEKISRMYGHEQFQRSFEYFKISPRGRYIGLTGSSGWCNILSGTTGQWVQGFKIEGTIVDFEFAHDESSIVVVNSGGEVWEFKMNPAAKAGAATAGKAAAADAQPAENTNKIIRRWQDDAGVGITKIKLGGPKNRWLAIGANNGIVNIYDRNAAGAAAASPKPFKCVENLVTSISSLTFSPDGQILVIASRAKKDAMRLVHLPSGTVYSNWPTSGTPLGRVTSVAISPNNEMLAVGNDAGKVTLWRLNHY